MQYPSAEQPLAVKAINRVGSWAGRVGIGTAPLNAERLMATAIKETGLSDFGDEGFLVGLRVLLDSLNEEARLSTIGRISAKQMLLRDLDKRLRLIAHRKERPEISAQQIERPLFVLGLPRTGSTIFYELLAQDPNHRWPITWEVQYPMPPARAESFETDERITKVQKELDQVEQLAPGFQAIHALGATLPQECIAMTASHFLSVQYGIMYFIPSYNAWMRKQDARAAYRWHRQFLQHLQADFNKPRWLLKSPGHLPFIEAIVGEYPRAAIVQTHRDPMRVMASVSSLACTLHSAFSDHVDPVETAACEAEHFADMLKLGLEQRNRIEAAEGVGRFFDVQFEDILKRPLDIIEQLYEHFDFEWSDDIRGRMRHYLENRPREKHGKHKYTLEEFALSQEEHGPQFADYCKRFGITTSQSS